MTNPLKDIPRWEDIYGGKFFSPADLHEGPVTAKITQLEYNDELFCKGAGKNARVVLTLEGHKKQIVVNKTSAKALAFAFGRDFNTWRGKTVTATGGDVNGKAAVLLRPVKDRVPPAQSKPPAPIPEPPKEPPKDDVLESKTITIASVKGKDAQGKYPTMDVEGGLWFLDEERYQAGRTMNVNGRPIGIKHFGRHIEMFYEV